MTNLASKQIVIILGAGPGLGYSCAKLFAKAGHPVALLSRSLSTLNELSIKLQIEIKSDENQIRAYSVDVTKKSEIEEAFNRIRKDDWGVGRDKALIHTGIFNPGGSFSMKPFLEYNEQDLREALETRAVGFFNFAQSFIRALQSNPTWNQPANPTDSLGNLLITGATASTRGSAKFSTSAASKFALKALGESIAREFGPVGIHCAHFVIDGVIVTPTSSRLMGADFDPNTRMDPDDIAQVYLDTSRQKRSTFSFNVDLRPSNEKW